MKIWTRCTFILIGISIMSTVIGQIDSTRNLYFFEPSPHFNKKRFGYSLGASVSVLTGTGIVLSKAWYSQYDQESFHLFDDMREWQQMDKAGHIYSAYIQSHLFYKGFRWTGVQEKNGILIGMLAGTIIQGTIEVLDGFSSNWGFSLGDIGANSIGVAAFALQQKHWKEQRILFKLSTYAKNYPNERILSIDGTESTTLRSRAHELYGDRLSTSWLKDYNAQSIWASFNVHSFLPKGNQWPKWLNIATGYSAENMFGGFENTWQIDGISYTLDPDRYPRYRQFFIGLDIDLNRIHVKNHFLKSLLSILNILKVPSPAIEINTRGEVLFHLIRL